MYHRPVLFLALLLLLLPESMRAQDWPDEVPPEIIEMPEMAHATIPGRGGVHHLGFRLPQRAWHALRARLDADRVPYQEVNNCLFIRDADGLVLELEKA